MSTLKYTPELLHAAIEGFEAQRRRIDAQLAVICGFRGMPITVPG